MPGQTAESFLSELATFDLYLDARSFLPDVLEFNIHPDNAGQNLPVRIQLSGYKAVAGVQSAYQLQKFLQGTLVLDISVTAVAFNTGLSPSLFQIQ